MEKDDEIYGNGNSYTAEYWQYDSRLGRRSNVDPIVKHHESPYACFANNPIWFMDPNGADSIKAPNGNMQNAGDGYVPYEHDGNHYLVGDGLKTKIWDPNVDTGSDQLGIYVDYEGDDPGFDVSGFLQVELRGSAIVTGSLAYGIAMSTDGTASVYRTRSIGGGLAVGLTYGITTGVAIGANSEEIEGPGYNYGLFVALPIMQFSGEINTYWSDAHLQAVGPSYSWPIPGTGGGVGVGLYADYSYTNIIWHGTIEEGLEFFWGMVNSMIEEDINTKTNREINSSGGILWSPWNDGGFK